MNEIKSIWASKTFLTAMFMSITGLLSIFHVLPASFDSAGALAMILSVGGALAGYFRFSATKALVVTTPEVVTPPPAV